jgi:hypothetical protein
MRAEGEIWAEEKSVGNPDAERRREETGGNKKRKITVETTSARK